MSAEKEEKGKGRNVRAPLLDERFETGVTGSYAIPSNLSCPLISLYWACMFI